MPPWFEGGQMPLYRRLPKLAASSGRDKEYFAVVNVERLNEFRAGFDGGPEELRARGLIKKRGRVKVLGERRPDQGPRRCGPTPSASAPWSASRPPGARWRSSSEQPPAPVASCQSPFGLAARISARRSLTAEGWA